MLEIFASRSRLNLFIQHLVHLSPPNAPRAFQRAYVNKPSDPRPPPQKDPKVNHTNFKEKKKPHQNLTFLATTITKKLHELLYGLTMYVTHFGIRTKNMFAYLVWKEVLSMHPYCSCDSWQKGESVCVDVCVKWEHIWRKTVCSPELLSSNLLLLTRDGLHGLPYCSNGSSQSGHNPAFRVQSDSMPVKLYH